MNEKSIKTCCPACNTYFNVTTGQLKVAAGMVRCGSCLHVFNATPINTANKPKASTPSKVTSTIPTVAQNNQPVKSQQLLRQKPIRSELLNIPEADLASDILPTTPPTSSTALGYISYTCISVLIALLIAQTLWFKQEQWAQHNLLRPVYSTLYELANLPLPEKKASQLILNKKFIIQPHEEFVDAIRVSLLLENAAHFPQPFPGLQILFTDLKGRTTSQRTLTAEEYINTALFPNQLMPSNQPIQIQIDLMAPGRRAVGYQLNMIFD